MTICGARVNRRQQSTDWRGPGRAILALSLAGFAFGLAVAPATAEDDGGASGPAVSLTPHEARYDLRLISRASGSPVIGARGAMHYRITDTCDGWAMESRTHLDLSYARADSVRTDWSFISWESKDSTQYRFRIRSERNGAVQELIDGRARMDPGEGGVATFSQPEEKTLDLAPDVMLPAEHTFAALREARQGERIFTVPMFDGSEPAGPMQATAVLTEAVPAGAPSELADHALLAGPSWRMVLSFFAPDSTGSLPEYEIRLRYHANGVAQEIIQDFGTMALRASLKELTPLDDGGC